MPTACNPSTQKIPDPLTAREREILAIMHARAMFGALKCADMAYSAAGVTFVQDGRFTKAIFDNMTVASFEGRFSKELLLSVIRSNIADHGKWVGMDITPVLEQNLVLPAGHVFRLDIAPQLDEIKKRGSNKFSAYVGGQPSATSSDVQVHAEFRISLHECQAHLTIATGDRLNSGESLLQEGECVVSAETYPELAEKIALSFNLAVGRAVQ